MWSVHLMSPHSAKPRFKPSICSLTLRNTASFAPIRRIRSSSAIDSLTFGGCKLLRDFACVALLLDDEVSAAALHDGRGAERCDLVARSVEEPARVRPHLPVRVEPHLHDLVARHVGALADERQRFVGQLLLR